MSMSNLDCRLNQLVRVAGTSKAQQVRVAGNSKAQQVREGLANWTQESCRAENCNYSLSDLELHLCTRDRHH